MSFATKSSLGLQGLGAVCTAPYTPGAATTAWCDLFGGVDDCCPQQISPVAPVGIASGLPVGYSSPTGTVSPTNTTGAVTTPTQAQQAAALAAALNPVIGSDPNVSAANGGAGDNSDCANPSACSLGCSWFNIGCPTCCDDSSTPSLTSTILWVGGGLLAYVLLIEFLETKKR